MLSVDAGSRDIQACEWRDREPAIECRERVPRAIWNGCVESVADSPVAQLAEARAVSEHFVRHDQEKMILRHIKRDELASAIEYAKRQCRPAALCADLERQPSIFCTRNNVLNREKPLRAGCGRHV